MGIPGNCLMFSLRTLHRVKGQTLSIHFKHLPGVDGNHMPKGPHCRVYLEKQCTGNEKLLAYFLKIIKLFFVNFQSTKQWDSIIQWKTCECKHMQFELNRLWIICTLNCFYKVHKVVQKSTSFFPCKSVRKCLWISLSPSSNHLTTFFAKQERLASVFRLVISLKKGEFVFTFWNSVTVCGTLDISIANSRIRVKRKAHPLFFRCRGSTCTFSIEHFQYIKIQLETTDLSMRLWGINTEFVGFIPQSLVLRSVVLGWILIYWNWSISLPILGVNSCLDCFSAMNDVTLPRLVLALREVLANLFSNSSTCFALLKVCHIPNVSTGLYELDQRWIANWPYHHRSHCQMMRNIWHCY